MRRVFSLRNYTSVLNSHSSRSTIKSITTSVTPIFNSSHLTNKPTSLISTFRFFSSSENDSASSTSSTVENPSNLPDPTNTTSSDQPVKLDVEDVKNKDFKLQLDKYLQKNEEEALPEIFEAVLKRKLVNKHEDTDDELTEELQFKPLDDVKDKEFESDFEELYETDEEIGDLYNARDHVQKKMIQDEFFNMDDKKWDDMIEEATKHGYLQDMTECEQILEDMLHWDKLLPDEIKQKVEAKFNELGDMCERGELEPVEAYELFKEFEDKAVEECKGIIKAKEPPKDVEASVPAENRDPDDPPGEGPILRWQTRVVFAPGGDAWHPKNRKVKLSVTVSELGLSKHAFRRLREVVGKRYHPGKDQLTITSERYEHREENRKDCLRTLYSLIEDAVKANKLVEESRTSYVKERLRANPEFMRRLQAKTMKMKSSQSALPQ